MKPKDYYTRPTVADVVEQGQHPAAVMTARARSVPSNTALPRPAGTPQQALKEVIHNVVDKVARISRVRIPTDREMKSLKIAMELLAESSRIAEGLAKPKPFEAPVAAKLLEGGEKQAAVRRLRGLVAPTVVTEPTSSTSSSNNTE